MEETKLCDLFYLEAFADLHKAAESLSDLPIALFDPEGHPVMRGEAYNQSSGAIAHPPGCADCRRSLVSIRSDTDDTVPYLCHRTGLMMVAVPVRAGRRLLGYWRIGPLHPKDGSGGQLPARLLEGLAAITGSLLHLRGMQQQVDRHTLMTRQLYKRLDIIAYHDATTGLPNLSRLTEDIQASYLPDEAGPWHLICLELSCMQNILHLHGVGAALAMTTAVANWISAQSWLDGGLYQIGHRRFAIRMRFGRMPQVMAVCHKLRRRFEQPWCIQARETFTTICSAAIAVIDGAQVHAGPDPASVIDRALASASAVSGVYHYNEAVDSTLRKNAQLDMLLKNDVINSMRGFDVHFQPIVDVPSGNWTGVEALCRWQSLAEESFIPPDTFIPLAEEARLISPIGLWVLESAVRHCKAMSLDALEGFFLSVNVSPLQLLDESFAGEVIQCLRRHSFPGKCLNLEITESTRFPHTQLSRETLSGLKEYGISLALDDFGTGFSSFTTLKHLPVNLMKTERTFLVGIEEDPYLQFVMGLISDLSHANRIRLVAEGVENDRQLSIVREHGADLAQGYLFARPMNGARLKKAAHRFGHPRQEVLLA